MAHHRVVFPMVNQRSIHDVCKQIEQVHRLADRFASSTRDHFQDRLKRVRLYGSSVRGDWTPDSDVDILVLLDHVSTQDVEWLSRTATNLGILDQGILIQPLPMAESEFQRLLNQERQFPREVEKTGRDL